MLKACLTDLDGNAEGRLTDFDHGALKACLTDLDGDAEGLPD
jgi:hypothetical protein